MSKFDSRKSTFTPRRPSGKKPTDKSRRNNGPRGKRASTGADDDSLVRLQKLLASAGIGSRRKCEELITSGRVTVDGRTVTQLGTKVDPETAEVRVDLEPLPRSHLAYFMVNKPIGVVSTNRDPSGRPRVVDLAPQGQRLFPIGRLDASSEGLILVTNDGELANLLAHPRYGVEKTYQVQVAGVPSPDVLERLRRGVHLAEGYAHAKRVWVKSQHKQSAILEMVLDEGKNREVRRLLAQVGHKVLHLRRTALGPLRLGDLPVGACRPLKREEVGQLRVTAEQGSGDRGQRSGNKLAASLAMRSSGSEDRDQRSEVRVRRTEKPGGLPRANGKERGGTVIGYPAEAGAGRQSKRKGGRRAEFRQRQRRQNHRDGGQPGPRREQRR